MIARKYFGLIDVFSIHPLKENVWKFVNPFMKTYQTLKWVKISVNHWKNCTILKGKTAFFHYGIIIYVFIFDDFVTNWEIISIFKLSIEMHSSTDECWFFLKFYRSWKISLKNYTFYNFPLFARILKIGTSYLVQFQKRAVTNLKNYSTKNNENLEKPKAGPAIATIMKDFTAKEEKILLVEK